MKILILGGYGVFGGRLAELLAHREDLELLIGGRNERKARRFCEQHRRVATMVPTIADRADIESVLQQRRPDVLVDASGPFQEYTGNPYSVVEACIHHRTHYLDFADGAEFVFGIRQFDTSARSAGVFVLSGVSSFPVLTAAVLREFQKDLQVHDVRGGIAPSPYAGVGVNVMRAVLGYAGGPVRLRRRGRDVVVGGLCESMRYTVAPPGRLPLENLLYSLVDVPDLRVIPADEPDVSDIWMGAGPKPEVLHKTLRLLARIRWRLKLPAYTPLASLCHWVINHLRFGEHRGGMFVEVAGECSGKPCRRSWHLLAEGDDGPYIPSMAISTLIVKLLNNEVPAAGARPATTALTLADYDQVFAETEIATGFRDAPQKDESVFETVLGDCFTAIPQSLQAFHGNQSNAVWEGRAEVMAGENTIAKIIARVFGFPTSNGETDVCVTVNRTGSKEYWQRDFGGTRFRSELFLGRGREQHLVCESFGWVTVALALVWDGERLWYVSRRWRLGRLPLPKFLLPGGDSFEQDANGAFSFDVELTAPIVGRLVAYKGKLRQANQR